MLRALAVECSLRHRGDHRPQVTPRNLVLKALPEAWVLEASIVHPVPLTARGGAQRWPTGKDCPSGIMPSPPRSHRAVKSPRCSETEPKAARMPQACWAITGGRLQVEGYRLYGAQKLSRHQAVQAFDRPPRVAVVSLNGSRPAHWLTLVASARLPATGWCRRRRLPMPTRDCIAGAVKA